MNAVSHCNRPRASSSAMIARQIRSHVPSSSQRFNRRQHVDGLGYSAGRSRHRAPVFSTQKMPSTTARWPTQGRPPRRVRGIVGGAVRSWPIARRSSGRHVWPSSALSGQCGTGSRSEVQGLSASSGGYETGLTRSELGFAERPLALRFLTRLEAEVRLARNLLS